MRSLLNRIISWIRKKLGGDEPPVEEHSDLYETLSCEDVPELIADKTVYLIGENNFIWCIVLLCPCGCNSEIQLNTLEEASPRWQFIRSSKDGLSISPSIWSQNGCKSHFFLKKGKIEWS